MLDDLSRTERYVALCLAIVVALALVAVSRPSNARMQRMGALCSETAADATSQ